MTTTKPAHRETVRDLVQEYVDRTGDSYSVVARKCGLSKAFIGQLLTSTTDRLITRESREKLCAGLNISAQRMAWAAIAQAGIVIPDSGDDRARLIAGDLAELSDRDWVIVRTLIQTMRDNR